MHEFNPWAWNDLWQFFEEQKSWRLYETLRTLSFWDIQMDKNGVSVVLTTLNEKRSIKILLERFLAQSVLPDEIIIVDGGSVDGTCEIVKEYADRNRTIRLYTKPGLNIAQGRNYGIKKSKNSIIAVTDGGCEPHRSWLENLIIPFKKGEDFDAVAGKIEIDSKNDFEWFNGNLCTPQNQHEEDKRLFFGRNCAFTKKVWQKTGGYPEWLYTAEDTLFALQVKNIGGRISYAPDAIVFWRPRRTFWKLFKMFFLYGRGNGRIKIGSLSTSFFWLKYHFAVIGCFGLGFKFWPFWLLGCLIFLYLLRILIFPELKKLKKRFQKKNIYIYVPIIVYARNLATHLGFILGQFEYSIKPVFKEKLSKYYVASPENSTIEK